MPEEKLCASCGKPSEQTVCAECAELERLNLLPSLPLIGFVFFLLLLIGFTVTRIAVSSFRAKQTSIANQWQSRGNSDLSQGRADAAVEDYENALVYERENAAYRLQLAKALIQAGRDAEARSHLRALWEERPGDSTVNLQLARLAARRGDLDSTERYYQGAIYGVWPDQQDPYAQREQVRLELAKALINEKSFERAQSQLVTVATELPTSSPRRKEVGDLLMQAGAPRLAFQQYLEARNRLKGGAGQYALELARAAYAQNDFALATRWANTAVRENPKSKDADNFLKQTAQVLESDPYQQGIGEQARAERVIRTFRTADARMGQCFPTYMLGPHSREAAGAGLLPAATMNQVVNFGTWAAQLRPQMSLRKMQHRDDVQENTMRFVFQTELFAAKNCAAPLGENDKALLSLAKERWSNE